MSDYVPGTGPISAKIMLLADCPTYMDSLNGKLFSDKNWNELDRLLKEAGISREACWQTSVSKYHIPPSPTKKKIPFPVRAKMAGIDLHQQLIELQNEVTAVKPNVIIALGGAALWALTGRTKIEQNRGSILEGMSRKVIPTYNPTHLSWQATDSEISAYWNRNIILFDLKRAKKQSEFSDVILPARNLQICKTSHQLYEFQQRYKNHTKPAIDIEARGTMLPYCIGLAFTPSDGLTVPLWNKGEIESLMQIPDSELIQFWIILDEILSNNDCVGQNFKYDQDKIKRLGFIIRSLASDTLLKASIINPELPKGLGFNTSIYTEEPFYKDEGMYEGPLQNLLIGCARDACVTKEIDIAMDPDLDELGVRDYYENFILQLHGLYLDIENVGFRTDEAVRDKLVRKYIEWDERVRYDLFRLTGTEINVNSHKQIDILLFTNLKLPQKPTTGEEDITALLLSPTAIKKEEDRRICELILEGRRVRKTISTYLMALPDYDGRMRSTWSLTKETGRTSTGQLDPPIRPKVEVIDEYGEKKKKAIGIAFQTMTKHGDIGEDVREQYVPDPGEIFVQADSAQAEARVVFLLANDEQALKDIDERDYHALTASWFFGGTEDDHSKRTHGYETPIRFAGKTLRHAGHLGAGKKRAAISVNTDARKYKVPISITEAIADRALKIFHRKQPSIQGVFHKGIIDSLGRGRKLTSSVPYGIDAKIGRVRTFYDRWGDELFRTAYSFIPQSSISDNTKAAALRLKKLFPWLKIIVESHDSLLFSIKECDYEGILPYIRQEFERPIRFDTCSLPRRDLVIPCEIEIGYNYKDFTKFKGVVPILSPKPITPQLIPVSAEEKFFPVTLPEDSKLTELIYREEERKRYKFYID